MAYIGREPQIGNFQVCDAISVVNNQAAYTMQVDSVNVSPETANHMLVSLNGILQAPTTSYTVSGSVITFAANLVTGDVINFIQILGSVLDLGVPSDATVSTAKIVDGAVTSAKLASGTGGKILQVVTATEDTQRSTTSTSFVTASNTLSVNITPSSTSSKIFITYNGSGYKNGNNQESYTTIFRDSTNIGNENMGLTLFWVGTDDLSVPHSASIIDSPNTTSQITYQVRIRTDAGTFSFPYKSGAGNGVLATITAFEIGA